MDVMTLAAQITLNSKQFENALGSAEGSLSQLARRIVSTQAVIKGLQMGFNGIKSVVQGGIDAFASYEQLVGGVDTLFKGASQKVQAYAEQAYATAGMSANQYMETATSFSASLLQGLKGDVDKAADLANVAIIDMSDNANKMGSDMQSIQNAYMGFAKGNFNMLDNLKLGYGGTKTEMIRLINDSGVLDKKIKSLDGVSFDKMIEAIHKIQQEMGITGTTAEEAAGTISGSSGSLSAAFQNLLTFATDGTNIDALQKAQDAFVSSFADYFNKNLAPRIVRGLNGSEDVFAAIASALLTIPDSALGDTADAFINSASGLLNSLTSVTGWIFDQLTGVMTNPKITEEDATKFGTALGNFVGTFISEGIAHLPDTISGLFTIGVNLANGLIQGLSAGLFGTGANSVTGEIKAVDEEMKKSILQANEQATKANGLTLWLEDLQKKYGEAATQMPEWKEAMQGLIDLSGDYYYFFDQETLKLNTSTDAMRKHTEAIRNMQIEEARNRALGEKQQIVDDLEAQKANLTGTINFEGYQQQALLGEAVNSVNAVLDELGISGGRISAGMTAGDFAEIARQLSLASGSDAGMAEQNANAWRKEIEENGVGFEQLTSLINEINGRFNIDSDEILAEIGRQQEAYKESTAKVEQANKDIDAINKDLESARYSLQLAEKALDLWAAKVGTGQFSTVGNYNIRDPRNLGGFPGHATGLDRVPFDGYVAQLHKDEAVLTSAEAAEWRRGGNGGIDFAQMASTISAAIVEGMAQVGFYFDRDQVAAAITPRVSQNIADGMSAWGYS